MLITLTTDFGLKDSWVGVLKGLLYSAVPNANIVDISHQIKPFDLLEAYYVIKSAYSFFPEKTIHLILVDYEVSEDKKPIIAIWKNQYFLSSDNGIISMLTSGEKLEFIINPYFNENENAMELFIRISSEIARGKSVLELGEPTKHLREQNALKPTISKENKRITGSIIHIDGYGNAVSNISKKKFYQIGKERRFEIFFRNYQITKVYNKYIEYESEKTWKTAGRLAIFNSSDLLEISIYRSSYNSGGTASSLLGLGYGSSVIVDFFDD